MIGGSESKVRMRATRETERRREKKIIKILNISAIVTMHLCMVTIAIVHKCTILHPLMWVFFWAIMCKMSNFFYFAKLYTS